MNPNGEGRRPSPQGREDKAADILGKILIEPVADSDAAFAEVTGVIRAEKILEVLTAPPCIHCEWVHSAGARPMCIDAAMIPV